MNQILLSTIRSSAGLLLAAGLTSGCVVYPGISGSGNLVSETRSVREFDSVSVSGSGKIRIRQGESEKLEIRADDNLMPYVRTEVSGGELRIWWERGNLRFSEGPVYTLEVRKLERLHLAGSLRADLEPLQVNRFEGQISGSGKIELKELKAVQVEFSVNGSGDVAIAEGQADQLEISVSGSGDARMPRFEAREVTISISGSGSAEVRALERLSARVSGSGNVTYHGSPAVNSSISGSGRVRSAER